MKIRTPDRCTLPYFLALITLLIAFQPATADIHLGKDVLGLSTETNSTGFFEVTDFPVGVISLHLLVFGYDHSEGIVAWDCAVIIPQGVLLANTELMGRGTNALPQPGNFLVTTQEPLIAVNGIVHLATLDFLTFDDESKQFFLSGDPLWVGNQRMGFSSETSEAMRLPFNWPNRCEDCPVFEIVYYTPVEETFLGQMKALYR